MSDYPMLLWRPRGHQLLFLDSELLEALAWPMVLTVTVARGGALRLAPAEPGTPGAIVVFGDELTAMRLVEDVALHLPPADTIYTAWLDRDGDAIIAVPGQSHTPLIPLTIHLTPQERQQLEGLALRYQVRVTDILTAFAADLAGSQWGSSATGLRSGGSDERLFAENWFKRNADPGWAGSRPQFMRRFDEEASG